MSGAPGGQLARTSAQRNAGHDAGGTSTSTREQPANEAARGARAAGGGRSISFHLQHRKPLSGSLERSAAAARESRIRGKPARAEHCVGHRPRSSRQSAWAHRVAPNNRLENHLVVRAEARGGSAPVGRLEPGDSARLDASVPHGYQVTLDNGTQGFVSKAWSQTVPEPVAASDPIRLGGWNIKRLGHGNSTNFDLGRRHHRTQLRHSRRR